jgi:hydroxymethylpyrimidine/phosphomethylpyrimidine kinase
MTIENREIELSWMVTAKMIAKFLKDDAPQDLRSELLRMAAVATSNAVVDDAAEARIDQDDDYRDLY